MANQWEEKIRRNVAAMSSEEVCRMWDGCHDKALKGERLTKEEKFAYACGDDIDAEWGPEVEQSVEMSIAENVEIIREMDAA